MRKILIIAFILFLSIYAQAQLALTPNVVSSGGNSYDNGNTIISWTVGELAVTTLEGNNLILTQGFQQPTIMGTGINRKEFEGEIFVYPNPMQDELFVRFDVNRPGNYILELQDVTGRIIFQTIQKPINPGEIIQLGISQYSTGMYYLNVISYEGNIILVKILNKTE